MSRAAQAVAAVLGLLLVAWYLSWTASRLDRLHARVEGARASLDAQLVRRAALTLELATSGLLDPASSMLLAVTASEARDAVEADRELAESDLSAALRATFVDAETVDDLAEDPRGRVFVAELASAGQRVELARRFHNDAVRSAQAVRRRRLVRRLRLAGHAPAPHSFEIDDTPPPVLVARSRRP